MNFTSLEKGIKAKPLLRINFASDYFTSLEKGIKAKLILS